MMETTFEEKLTNELKKYNVSEEDIDYIISQNEECPLDERFGRFPNSIYSELKRRGIENAFSTACKNLGINLVHYNEDWR